MAGPFDDLIPQQAAAANPFADLIPQPVVFPGRGPGAAHTVRQPGDLCGLDMLSSTVNAAARGATFNLADKAAAALDATLGRPQEWLGLEPPPPGDWTQRYQTRLQTYRNLADQAAAQAPATMGAAWGAGALLGAKALPKLTFTGTPAATTAGRIGQAALQGGAAGAGAAFAGTNDQSLPQDLRATAIGAGTGAALAGTGQLLAEKVVAPIAGFLAEKFGGQSATDNRAIQQILQRMRQDANAGGPTAQDMLDAVNQARQLGKPISLADVGGENVQGLAERLATQPGESRTIASRFLNERDLGAGGRLAGDVDQAISGGPSAYETAQALLKARAEASRPLYDAVMRPDNVLSPSDFNNLLANNPLAADALKAVRADPVLSKSIDGLPDSSLPVLDLVKRHLDDMWQAAKIGGALNKARIINGARGDFLGALDQAFPGYSAARAAYAGPTESMNAVEEGTKLFTKSPAQIADEIKDLSAGDLEFYKLGAADALKERLAGTSSGGNEALKIIGNAQVRARLRPLFGSDAAYKRFIDAAALESRMFQTRTMMLGNSRTAARMAEMANQESGALQPILEGAAAFGTGEPILGIKAGAGALQRLMGLVNRPSAAVDSATARLLFSPPSGSFMDTLLNAPARAPIPLLRAPTAALAAPIPARLLSPAGTYTQ